MPRDGFFHLAGVEIGEQPCQGTACFVARDGTPDAWPDVERSTPRVYCWGKCYAAPATARTTEVPPTISAPGPAIVLERIAAGVRSSLDDYAANGGYVALERARAGDPGTIVDEVERSGLRGRGGAGYPTGKKWRAVHDASSLSKYVVVNADEGDPGAYIDRVVLERDPHCVLEAAAIAALAVGATRAFVYARREYPGARAALVAALEEVRAAGILDPGASGGPGLDVEIVDGAGSYVCGEETALLNAIERRRPEPRPRPPFPASSGLWHAPTLVDNVETLANVPWIIRHGGDAFAALGSGASRGTKVFSLNSLFARPGLYEVELGLALRALVELGGGLHPGPLHGVIIGGPLAGIVPPDLLDTPLTFEDLDAIGASLGHGGVVAFDRRTSIRDLLEHVFRFGAYESCGKCTPCRIGAGRVETLLRETALGETDRRDAARFDEWRDIVAALGATSLCGHGTGLADLARSAMRHYPEEVAECFG